MAAISAVKMARRTFSSTIPPSKVTDVEGADLSDASIPTDSIQQPLSPGNSSLVPGARIMRSVDNTIELRGRLGFGQMPLNPAVSTDGKLKILHGVRFVP